MIFAQGKEKAEKVISTFSNPRRQQQLSIQIAIISILLYVPRICFFSALRELCFFFPQSMQFSKEKLHRVISIYKIKFKLSSPEIYSQPLRNVHRLHRIRIKTYLVT